MTVSHHFLRRRARRAAAKLRTQTGATYVVERAEKGPWRWRVVKKTTKRKAT